MSISRPSSSARWRPSSAIAGLSSTPVSLGLGRVVGQVARGAGGDLEDVALRPASRPTLACRQRASARSGPSCRSYFGACLSKMRRTRSVSFGTGQDLRRSSMGLLSQMVSSYLDSVYYLSACRLSSPARNARSRPAEQVIEAAARVFARRGYHKATVDEIASEAGFTIGALYSNFSGKEELFLAIADRQAEARVGRDRGDRRRRPRRAMTPAPRPPTQSAASSRPIRTGRFSSTSSGR